MSKSNTLGDFVEKVMDKYCDLPAYQCAGEVITYMELEEKSRALAGWLQTRLTQGDRVAIQLPNINEYPIAAMAVLRAGMVLVNTNPLYTPREMQHQFSDSGAKAVIILSSLIPNLNKIIADTEIQNVITVGAVDKALFQDNAEYTSLSDAVNSAEDSVLVGRSFVSPDSVALLQYTGGTTGVAKGAMLTHRNILSNVKQVKERLKDVCNEGEETFICPLPLYHIYAFTVNMIFMFGEGNLNVLIPNPRDISAFVGQIEKIKFTGMSGINTLFVGLCSNEQFKKLDFSTLKLTISGGTSLVPEVAKKWIQTTGSTITEGYGLTETSPVAVFNTPGNEDIGSIGHPVINTVVDIRDLDGKSLGIGEAGELLIKGPQVMGGYWHRPDATQDAFTEDGFFRTGDIAIRKENGNLCIVDRLKDMILVSGFNVYPNEIEAVLCAHPKVLEAAVVGRKCDKSGEEVLAFVTVYEAVSEKELLKHCRENLTGYKVPKSINLLEEMPKSTVGKILRRELRCTPASAGNS